MEKKNRGVIGNIAQHPISFSVAFVIFATLTISFLSFMDVLPEPISTEQAQGVRTPVAQAQTQVKPVKAENPVRITIEKLGMDVTIKNPESTKVSVLDEALLSGAVRYPTSARLGQDGTVLLFGHSSNLPVIHNQAYKAFRGIQTLTKGEIISVYSDTAEYRYSVTNVSVADADEDVIELAQKGKFLTLVTCDTFTKKSARFVVTAKFVGAYSLTSR
jgi:LPXTG-site transpeptidase (sortase) family protein